MIKFVQVFIFVLFTGNAFSQCDDIFISNYVEGSSNNRALEIYNPTNRIIDLSEYSVGRFRNGATRITGARIPSGHSIGPDETFVIVLDKRDSLGTGFETAVWNGYLKMQAAVDTLTGEVRLDNNGDTLLFPVFNEELDRYEYTSYYREKFDLQSKADIFVNPIYQQATSYFYFNGDDAVALIKGDEVISDGSNVIDVIGVIGENPESLTGNPYWTDGQGRRMTQNSTLVRRFNIESATGVVLTGRDTFPYGEWIWRPNNTFTTLGNHSCNCHDISSTSEPHRIEAVIYPNPAPLHDGRIHIESESMIEELTILNSLGVELARIEDINSQDFFIELNKVSIKHRGIYFLNAKDKAGKSLSSKIYVK